MDNPGDLDRFYLTPPAEGIAPLHDLYLACEADARWEPFRTKSAYVRALTGGTCLMYQVCTAPERFHSLLKGFADPPMTRTSILLLGRKHRAQGRAETLHGARERLLCPMASATCPPALPLSGLRFD